MAHIFSLAAPPPPAYHEGSQTGDQVKFPDTGFFQGFNKPSRLEADIFECETTGSIPKDINGTFYRVQPDHQFPPVFEEDVHFNGDGSVSAFKFDNGHVDFKQRFVHTDRFKAERSARKSLLGKYRNPYTDNEMVKGIIRTASNTNIIFWRGVLLATKEDGPPFAMDPTTLETIGRYDFDGQVLSPTFTAHPKFDPDTGEMVCFGYEAGGNGYDESCDVVVYTIDKDGKKTEECWYKTPFCGMIHDCALTKNYLILPLTPIKINQERLEKGGNKLAWDPNEDQWYGIVPRRGGKPEDIVWLRADNGRHCCKYVLENQIDLLAQGFMAMSLVATKTRTATSSAILQSPLTTSSFSSRPTIQHPHRQPFYNATSSSPIPTAGSSTPRPPPTCASNPRVSSASTASSLA